MMTPVVRFFPVALVVMLVGPMLGACTNVLETGSLWKLSDGQAPGGISYTLAKAVLQVRARMFEREARIVVCVTDEIPMMDDRHQYTMTFRNSPLSADTITVRTYPGSNILREINVTAIDQTGDFIVNLAGSIGSLASLGKEAAFDPSDCESKSDQKNPVVELSSVYIDPGNLEDMRLKMSVLNEVVMTYVGRLARHCADPNSRFAQLVSTDYPDTCPEYARIAREFHRSRTPITLTWKHPDVPNVQPTPDCSVGICYRPRLTHLLTVDVGGARSNTQAFSFTNTSPLLAMDISRGIAITKTTKIAFDVQGQPSSITLRKGKDSDGSNGAEAVELAKLPATVISGYFGAFNKSVGYVNAALSSQSDLVRTQATLRTSKAQGVAKKEGFEEVNAAPTYAMSVSNVGSAPATKGSSLWQQISKAPNIVTQPKDIPNAGAAKDDPGKPSGGGFGQPLPKSEQ